MRNTIEISAPTIEPISVAQGKAWLSIGGGYNDTFDDTILAELIKSSRQEVEKYTEKPIIIREFQTTYDRIDNCHLRNLCSNFFMELPKQPIVSIVSVKYIDEDDVEQTVDSSEYYFDSKKIVFNDLTHTTMRAFKSFIINYTAGFSATQEATPDDLKTALKYFLSNMYNIHYNNRGASEHTLKAIEMEKQIDKRAKDILNDYRSSSFFDDGGSYGR